MKQKKSNLDEHQELMLLKIESRGCCLAFWGLLIVILTEMLVSGTIQTIMGEWIIFTGLGLYLTISRCCVGIGERRWNLSQKYFLIISFISGLFVVGFVTLFCFLHVNQLTFSRGTVSGLITFILVYLLCTLSAQKIKKRQDKLNAEPIDEIGDT